LNFQCAEVFQDDDVVSLVMECCNGGDLFDLIASHAPQGGLAEPCAARVQARTVTFLFQKKRWKPDLLVLSWYF
jgi:serine/threonine protein kinase